MPDRNTIRDALVGVINQIAAANGATIEVSDATCAMAEIPNFTSLIAEEAMMLVSDRLGVELESQVFYREGQMLTLLQSTELAIEELAARLK